MYTKLLFVKSAAVRTLRYAVKRQTTLANAALWAVVLTITHQRTRAVVLITTLMLPILS